MEIYGYYEITAGNFIGSPLSMNMTYITTFMGFPGSSAGKESTCNEGDLGSIPGLGKSPGEGKGHPVHYSGLENSIDCTVHGVIKSQTQLSDFHIITLTSRLVSLLALM